MYPNIHSSTIYNNQDMEAAQVPIKRWIDKKDVGYVCVCVYVYVCVCVCVCEERSISFSELLNTWNK